MITWLKVALVIFTAVLLQVTVIAKLPIADVRGDIVLLVAIVAAIALTLRRRKNTKYVDPARQLNVRRQDRVRIVSMPAESREERR